MSDAGASGPGFGARIRAGRLARGMSRQAVAALCGRSEEWLRGIESGRDTASLRMVARFAEVLRLPDLTTLLGAEAPTVLYTRPVHPELARVRAAVLAPVPDGEPPALDRLHAAVRQAWVLRTASDRDRSDLARVLPALVTGARQAVRQARGAEERRAACRSLAEVYHLTQLFLCYQDAPELLWLVADRGMNAARDGDDATLLARAAWFTAYLYRDSGMVSDAHRVVEEALRALDAELPTPAVQRHRRAVHLASAANHARDGRPAPAWRAFEAAAEAAREGGTPRSPYLLFGADCTDVALALEVELGRPTAAVLRAERIDLDAVRSVPRRARLMIEAARGYLFGGEPAGAVQMLRRAYRTSREATLFSRHARAVAHELAAHAGSALRPEAHALARDLGIPIR